MIHFCKGLLLLWFSFVSISVVAQYNAPFYLSATEATERSKVHDRIIQNIIIKNLDLPLSDETEANWQGAFNAMEVVDYHDAFTWQKMQHAMVSLPFHSVTFQRHVLETAYALYPTDFIHEATALLNSTSDPKIFSMCAVYLIKANSQLKGSIESSLYKQFGDTAASDPILFSLVKYMNADAFVKTPEEVVKELLGKKFLKGNTVLFSIQRKNRDYPGMVLIRKKDGEFLKIDSEYFHIPQLARGIANLPYFLTKGNTPQGIYRMFGFGVSVNPYIGPTANIQMGMPVELNKLKFLGNSADSNGWVLDDYLSLLPSSLKNYVPLRESYYAGLAGRNEIIAHGTTIDPEYYKGKPYYPMTPTEGCLCTKEFWDGKLIYSDQQKLVNALLAAGGAYGYVVVFELDDEQAPVRMSNIKEYLDAIP